MSAGRRGLLLSVAFFALTLCLCSRASAQPQIQFRPVGANDPHAGRHTIWQRELSPDQIRELLSRFGKGDKNVDNLLENAIRDRIAKNNKTPLTEEQKKRMDAAIKRMMADKDFMDWALDQAQKHKNQTPGEPFELTPEMIENLKKRLPDGGKDGDPFKMPKFDPNQFPKFDPNNPHNFDPKQFPNLDPKTRFPIDNRTGKPFDPRTGRPIDPDNPPKVIPVDPPPPPKIDPITGRPVDPPPNPEPTRKFDPNNPLGPSKESPEKMAKTKAAETATALWEKNVGPIEESPAVKRAILELVSDPETMDALTDGKGNSIFDLFRNDGEGMKDLFGGDGKGWEWPKFDMNLNWGKDRNIEIPESKPRENRWPHLSGSDRRSGSSMGGMGSFNFGGMQVPWLLALLFLAAILGTILWWKWASLFPPGGRSALAGAEAGAWPIDPRAINTREDVVKAFEFLSVLICGPGAKTWTHTTIADELTALAATHGETALKLARLYELARYAPLDEPLTRAEIIEARRLVCDLAGVDEA